MSVPAGPGHEVVAYQQASPGLAATLRAIAEQRRRDHTSDLRGRCRVDRTPHSSCYEYIAAGLVLSAMADPAEPQPSSARTAAFLLGSVVAAVVGLAAVWAFWVR
ncbi:MAG TPA: hypothetical protein VHJ83_06590 [Micromonosporaceae bacterium]|nr:hypothetical protein [Micromonosporaceae bacterium]